MARVLIGWELGSGLGHIALIRRAAESLAGQGHDVALALQQPDRLPADAFKGLCFQAPVWPSLLVNRRRASLTRVSTIIDILCRLGLSDAGTLRGLIVAWDAILHGWRPDHVVANFAPALLLAARGRVPSISTGAPFYTPASATAQMRRFDGAPGHDEALVLDTVDAELRDAGREPLTTLPMLFAANHVLLPTFTELDPYAGAPDRRYCAPKETYDGDGDIGGDEIFLYGSARTLQSSGLFETLSTIGVPVRTHLPDADAAMKGRLMSLGLRVEPLPLSWAEIARRSRLILSHGGHGVTCGALLAGLPQLVTHYDMEKSFNADAVGRLGVGWSLRLGASGRDAIRQTLERALADRATARRSAAAAARFRRRATPPFGDTLAALVAS